MRGFDKRYITDVVTGDFVAITSQSTRVEIGVVTECKPGYSLTVTIGSLFNKHKPISIDFLISGNMGYSHAWIYTAASLASRYEWQIPQPSLTYAQTFFSQQNQSSATLAKL